MKKKLVGFELPNKMHFIKVEGAEQSLKIPKKKGEKHTNEWLKEFLLTEQNYNTFTKEFEKFKIKSFPENIDEGCLFCKGEKKGEGERNCEKHHAQIDGTFIFFAHQFVNIVLSNKHIYNSKKELYRLTKKFYECFYFFKGKGVAYFDLDSLIKHSLNAGFLSISEHLKSIELINGIEIINHTLNALDQEEIENDIYEREDYNFVMLQKKFLLNKHNSIMRDIEHEKLVKENKISPTSKTTKNNLSRPNRTDIAYYCYYTSETKTLKIKNTFPSDKAWQEIGKRYDKNSKNIQLIYNEIVNDRNERTKKSRIKNITYVINSMLTDNEKASFLAKNELNTAKSNS